MKNFAWEDDKTHSGFAYNTENGWKGEQLKFMFNFMKDNFMLDPSKTLKVLDIGCNAALNMKRFSETYKNNENEYYGYDINETALKLARKNMPNGNFFKTNFCLENVFLDYEDNFFDFCFATWVFTHLPAGPNREKTIKEVLRTSKRGIILDPCLRNKNIDSKDLPFVLSSAATDQDPTNVVILDDYKRYETFVKEYHEVYTNNTAIFYWNKT